MTVVNTRQIACEEYAKENWHWFYVCPNSGMVRLESVCDVCGRSNIALHEDQVELLTDWLMEFSDYGEEEVSDG